MKLFKAIILVSIFFTSCAVDNHGGIIVYEQNGHGLVAAPADLGRYTSMQEAQKACEELVLNGYSDWRLPTKEELMAMYVNLRTKGLGGFSTAMDSDYWSSSESSDGCVWKQNFGNGTQYRPTIGIDYVRAVRSF